MPRKPSPYRIECPHEAPCWCDQCQRAYMRVKSRAHRAANPKPVKPKVYSGLYRENCPHPAPCKCKECARAFSASYRAANADVLAAKAAAYRAEHADKASERNKAWRAANADALKAKAAARYAANADAVKADRAAYYAANAEMMRDRKRALRAADPEGFRQYRKAHYAANADRLRAVRQAHRKKNGDRIRAYEASRDRREQQKAYRAANPHQNAERARRRRARVRNNGVVPYTRSYIEQRDKGLCHICGCNVDLKLRFPDPMSGVIDHLIPIALGGPDAPENVKLAHRRCNGVKGTKPVGEQLMLIG